MRSFSWNFSVFFPEHLSEYYFQCWSWEVSQSFPDFILDFLIFFFCSVFWDFCISAGATFMIFFIEFLLWFFTEFFSAFLIVVFFCKTLYEVIFLRTFSWSPRDLPRILTGNCPKILGTYFEISVIVPSEVLAGIFYGSFLRNISSENYEIPGGISVGIQVKSSEKLHKGQLQKSQKEFLKKCSENWDISEKSSMSYLRRKCSWNSYNSKNLYEIPREELLESYPGIPEQLLKELLIFF